MLSDKMKAQGKSMGGTKALFEAMYAKYGKFEVILTIEDFGLVHGAQFIVAQIITEKTRLGVLIAIDDESSAIAGLSILPPLPPTEHIAQTYLQLLIDGKHDAAEAMLCDEMKAVLESNGGTEAIMEASRAESGELQRIDAIEYTESLEGGRWHAARVSTTFGNLQVLIVISPLGCVTGLELHPL